jgi:hypothetical protein
MDFEALVGKLGVTVETGDLPDGWWGAYHHRERKIILRPGLGGIQGPSVLMHELGHAHYGHTSSGPAEEREASHWAARRLIPMKAFIAVCQIADTAHGIAHHLGVLPRDVTNFVDALTHEERVHIHLHVNSEVA